MRRSARVPNDSEDEGVISLSACKKFRRCKTRVGCTVAAGPIGSKGKDGKDSSFVRFLSNCCCDDEINIDGEDLLLMVGHGAINFSDEDVDTEEWPSMAAAGVFSDSDGGGELGILRSSDFHGSSTRSLTESNAADTQRSDRTN